MLKFMFKHFVAVIAVITFVIASYAHFGPGQHAKYSVAEDNSSTSTTEDLVVTEPVKKVEAVKATSSSVFSIFKKEKSTIQKEPTIFSKEDYDTKMLLMANRPGMITVGTTTRPAPTTTLDYLWPVQNLPYPKEGAILPYKRIIAYYGNLYSRRMGALGEYDEPEMLQRLQNEVDKWNKADPTTESIPALHYIAVTAQEAKGADGKYRLRMPHTEIDKIIRMASSSNAIVFIDIQAGLSTIEEELPLFEKYLKMPNVHLGIDPEFYMIKSGKRPAMQQITWQNWLMKIIYHQRF
jgi:hypothetical protein